MLLTSAAGIALGAALGWPLAQGLFFGGAIAISSTMVILKTSLDRGEFAAGHGRVLLGMLIVRDLGARLIVVALPDSGATRVTVLNARRAWCAWRSKRSCGGPGSRPLSRRSDPAGSGPTGMTAGRSNRPAPERR